MDDQVETADPRELCRRIWAEIDRGGAPTSADGIVAQLAALRALRGAIGVEEAVAVQQLRTFHGWSWAQVADLYSESESDIIGRFDNLRVEPTSGSHRPPAG